MSTVLAGATKAFAAGFWLITLPAATDELVAIVTVPTLSPAAVIEVVGRGLRLTHDVRNARADADVAAAAAAAAAASGNDQPQREQQASTHAPFIHAVAT